MNAKSQTREDLGDPWAAASSLLSELARRLATSERPQDSRLALCDGAKRLASAHAAVLLEATNDPQVLVVSAAVGAEAQGVRVSIEDPASAAAQAVRSEQQITSVDPGANAPEYGLLRKLGARSVVWQPVGRLAGGPAVLAVAWRGVIEELPTAARAGLELLGAGTQLALTGIDEVHRLQKVTLTDELTGLPNRRMLEEQLPREIARARRTGAPLCIAMLDLDHFKAYNDAHGHIAGDRHLQRVATAWLQTLRPYDTLARFGGEEFVAILPGCDLDAATTVVERLRVETPGGESCSAGVVEAAPNEHPDVLIARGDAALYEAKRGGRNRTVAHRTVS